MKDTIRRNDKGQFTSEGMMGNKINLGRPSPKKGKHTGIIPKTAFKTGQSPWNKGTGVIAKCLNCGKTFYYWKRKAPRKFCSRECMSIGTRGENHPRWNGGQWKIREILKGRKEYKFWRKSVFERDDYTCQSCGKRGGILNAHHIKEWAKEPKLRYLIINGITLCRDCHLSVHFNKSFRELFLQKCQN